MIINRFRVVIERIFVVKLHASPLQTHANNGEPTKWTICSQCWELRVLIAAEQQKNVKMRVVLEPLSASNGFDEQLIFNFLFGADVYRARIHIEFTLTNR